MARPRTPKAKATATGQAVTHKDRFEGRNEPRVDDQVGEPFEWLGEHAKQAWHEIVSEVPWLNGSHRGFLAIAANIRGRMIRGDDCGVQSLNLLRMCYGQMGATPSDASKIGAKSDGDKEDPADQYF